MSRERELSAQIEALLEAPVSGLGYTLLDVQYRFEGRWILRLFIDGPRGIGIDDCGAVSELVGRLLDVEDPIPNDFSLEVSSPGLFRPLKEPKHYRQSIGKRVRFTLTEDCMEDWKSRVAHGAIMEVRDESVLVDVGGTPWEFPFTGIHSAKLDPEI